MSMHSSGIRIMTNTTGASFSISLNLLELPFSRPLDT